MEGVNLKELGVIDFFTRVTKLVPTEDQKKLLLMLVDPKYKGILISAGRQTGKTLCCAVATIWLSLKYDQINILLTSAQDNWLYAHIKDIWNRNQDLRGYVAAEGVFGIVPLKGYETKTGSKVHVRPSTEKGLRGVPADVAFLDEAAEMVEATINTALGNLSGEFNKIILLSTPHKTGKFTELITDPEKYGFVLFHWSEEGCSWHSKEELARKELMMTPQQYKMEVQGLPLDASERTFFPAKHLEKCTMEVEPIKEGGPKSIVEVGIDPGFNSMVLIVTERIGSIKRKVIFIKEWSKKPIETVAPEIAALLKDFRENSGPGFVVKMDSKPAEYKGWIERFIQVCGIPIHYIDAALMGHKDQMLGQLERKVREHQLIIPSCFVELIVQMKKYRRGMQTGDDYVDALALSCYEPVVPLGSKDHGCIHFPSHPNVRRHF